MTANASARLLDHPGLRALVTARGLSNFAWQMQGVALGWQVYALTGRAFALGLVGLAQFLPVVALVFVAGHTVDRGDRRRIASNCQALLAAAAFALAIVGWHDGSAAPVWLIYALVVAAACARAFESPSLQALLPSFVPAAAFPRAAALNSSISQTATILGPSLGGLLYGLGAYVAYAACAVAFIAAAIATRFLPRATTQPRREPPTLAALFGGIGFIRARPDILGAISLDLFAVLLGGATALLPIYASDILRAGPFGLGLLRASPALGALLVSATLARRPMRRRLGARMFAAVAVFGLATIVFGLSRSIPLSVAALAVLGGADVISVVIRSSLVQLRTPDEMRGRVGAVNLLFIGSSNQLGEFESGSLAALVGPVAAVVLGGVGTLAVVASWLVLFPSLRRLDRIE